MANKNRVVIRCKPTIFYYSLVPTGFFAAALVFFAIWGRRTSRSRSA